MLLGFGGCILGSRVQYLEIDPKLVRFCGVWSRLRTFLGSNTLYALFPSGKAIDRHG